MHGNHGVAWRWTGAGVRTASALALAVLLALAMEAEGQGVVTGTVLDDAGSPLARAQIVVVGSDRYALTDREGRFILTGLGSGRIQLEATLPGYAPALREIDLRAGAPWSGEPGAAPGEAGAPAQVTFSLRPTALSLPGLVVTGAATGGAALDLTRAASQLSGRALERSVGGTLAETLSGQPGLAVRYNGPGAAAPVLRGLTGDRVVVMQDGHRTADLAGSAEDHIVTIDPLSAQRIEIIRGPAALLYGNNALGGVVNVLTGDVPTHGPSARELSAAVQVESVTRGATAQARAAIPLAGPWALGLRMSGRSASDVRVGGSPGLVDRLPDSWLRHGSGAVSLGYGGPRVVGGVTVRHFGFDYGVPTPPEEEESLRLDGRLLSASARFEVLLDSPLFPSVRVAASASDYSHEELEDGDVEMAFALRTGSLDVQARQAAGRMLDDGAWGASLVARDYVASGEDQLTAPARSWAAGVFTYQQLPVGDAASIQLGGRADRYVITSRDDPHFGAGTARSFTALSGSLGTSVTLAPGVTAAVSAARSFRAPTVEELFSDAPHAGTASYEVGDPTLAPETMRGVEGVLRVRSDRIVAEAAAHVSRIDDFVTFAARGDTLIDGVRWPVLAYVQHPASMHGVEASADWIVRDGVVLGVRGDLVRGALDGGDPIPFLPPARLGATARWEPGSFSMGAEARHAFAQRRVSGDPDVETASYTLVDLDAGFRILRGAESHSLTLRVANATDRHYHDAASRIKRFAANPGRNVALLYRIHF